jgi:hypothetical protein
MYQRLGRRASWGLALIMLVFGYSNVQAQVVFSPTFSYVEEKQETESSTSRSRETRIDLRLGLLSDGFFIGALVNSETVDNGGGTTEKGSGIGPSIGLIMHGFNLIATYHALMVEREYKQTSSTTKRKDGSGLQVDLGYSMDIGSGFGLGPQISWRSIEYKKHVSGSGVETEDKLKITEIRPMVAMFFTF